MTSLPTTMKNADLRETKQIIYHSKGIDESYPKMYFLLNLSHHVKSYGHLCQILVFLTMPALQIWPCHVTQEANFKKIYLFLILHLTLDKAAIFLVEKFSTLEVISQKPHGGGKHPPSAFRVNQQKMRTQPIHHTTNLQTMCPANFRIRLLFDHNNFGHNHQRNSTVPEQIYSACPAFTKIHQCKAAAWFLWPSIRER